MLKKLFLSFALVSLLLAGCGDGAEEPGLEEPADLEEPAGEGEDTGAENNS